MSHKLTDGGQVMHVGTLARVEGEGAMHIEYRDGVVTDVQLRIYEPPRFYEAFLRGRAFTEPPDITARICGICPVAYQMSSCWAIEDACGVEVPEEIRLMRRLLYCGEWIESHALHIFLLHAPDFLGYDGAIEMAADHPDVVERGLRLKKAGNDLMDTGRRPLGPPGQRPGRRLLPDARRAPSCARCGPRLERARDEALETVRAGRGLRLPGLRAAVRVPLAARRARATRSSPAASSPRRAVPLPSRTSRSTSRSTSRTPTPCTPASTARRTPTSWARSPATRSTPTGSRRWPGTPPREAGLGPTCRNPFRSIVVRAVELVEAYDEALRIIDGWTDGASPSRAGAPAGRGGLRRERGAARACCSTATSSTTPGSSGTPRSCRRRRRTSRASRPTCAPSSQAWSDLDDHALLHRCEQAIRNYDPCISCATHFLDLTVDRT